MKNLIVEKYIMIDVRDDKTSRTYIQNIIRHVKILEFIFIYNQLLLT